MPYTSIVLGSNHEKNFWNLYVWEAAPGVQGCQIGGPWAGSIMHRPRPSHLHKSKNLRDTSCDVIEFDTCDIGLEETMQLNSRSFI